MYGGMRRSLETSASERRHCRGDEFEKWKSSGRNRMAEGVLPHDQAVLEDLDTGLADLCMGALMVIMRPTSSPTSGLGNLRLGVMA